jgi:Suppressor of fused protein (SUFU)
MAKAADAVVGAVAASKGKAELFSWGVNKTWADGGDDPCEDLWVHDSDEEAPHWHYVTSGLSDPAKVEAAPGATTSGLGYELTFRLKRAPGEQEAPEWPWKRLQELGWGIFKANMKLGVGHYLRRRTVITGGNPETTLQGYYLIADPRLPATTSDTGSIAFLQAIGITDEELLRCEAGEPDEMEALLLEHSPLGITDIARTVPDQDEVDLLQLNHLQTLLARNCVNQLAEGTTSLAFSTSADEAQVLTHDIPEGAGFKMSRRVEATVMLIFALHWAAGAYVNRILVQLTKKPDGTWSTVLDFEYEPD